MKHGNVGKKLTEDEKHSALKQILDNAIRAEGVNDIFALAGLENPNIRLRRRKCFRCGTKRGWQAEE